MGFAVAPSRFLVKQISAKSTGCRASRRKVLRELDREVVFSWLAPKSRRGSGPPIELMRIERAPRIAKAPAQGLPVVN